MTLGITLDSSSWHRRIEQQASNTLGTVRLTMWSPNLGNIDASCFHSGYMVKWLWKWGKKADSGEDNGLAICLDLYLCLRGPKVNTPELRSCTWVEMTE